MFEKDFPHIWTALRIIRAVYHAIIRILFLDNIHQQSHLHHHKIPSSCLLTEENEDFKISSRDINCDSQDFLDRVEKAFCGSLHDRLLLSFSCKLKSQFYDRLQDPSCLLPSFHYQLPSGTECGKFIALDLGGTTLRVALIKLCGNIHSGKKSEILNIKSFKITSSVKALSGHCFFQWMAERIEETLVDQDLFNSIFPMGISWSFPIEQTSHRSGRLMEMGKGFSAADGLIKQDLGKLIQDCCRDRGLNVHLDAIINDSSASFLSTAYVDASTRFALILGTGLNAAVYLPVHLFTPSKFGIRPPEWHALAEQIIVNTEMSMMGKDFLPVTKWDIELRSDLPNPEFQPFEYFVGGRYLGEIVRLVLIDGIENAGLFGGIVPPSLREKYSLDTQTISEIEVDHGSSLAKIYQILSDRNPLVVVPTARDLLALRFISSHVVHRATRLVAAGVHALWEFRREVTNLSGKDYSQTLVACNGSVIENYPGFATNCQDHLDCLIQASGGVKGQVKLVFNNESSLIGAAVASATAS